jgi:hypothetical protein
MSDGQLVFIDAATLLAEIMTEGTPNVLTLKNRLGQIIEKASSNPAHPGQARRVRIFGELVNLLYMAGNIPAALLVEQIDEEIIEANHSVSLFLQDFSKPRAQINRSSCSDDGQPAMLRRYSHMAHQGSVPQRHGTPGRTAIRRTKRSPTTCLVFSPEMHSSSR